MKRTTVLADEGLLLELKLLARQEGKSVSDLVRNALQEYLRTHRTSAKRLSFYSMGASGETDVAERAEQILAREIKRESGWDVDPH